jgi:acetyltransferase
MILQRAQLPIPNEYLAITANEAASSVKRIGKPVVMKVVSRDLPHKSDIGGVIKNVSTPEEAAEAFERILSAVAKNRPDAKVDGVLVSEMIDAEVELIVGLKNDPVFGPVIMTGLGGIFVEIFKDVSTRILPIGPAEAREMIEELKAYPLLVGARGGRAKDVEAVVDFLVRVGHIGVAMENQLAELDVNPLMVLDRGKGVKAVDALVSLK